MELQGDVGHVESRIYLFRDSVSVGVSCKSFWTHPTILLGDEAQVEARFGLFGDSANLEAR
jgi:hypothetical protein